MYKKITTFLKIIHHFHNASNVGGMIQRKGNLAGEKNQYILNKRLNTSARVVLM